MSPSTIVLAGGSGDLGTRILKLLVARGARVRALVRHDASPADVSRLAALGATIGRADVHDVRSVAAASEGASCVVSALNRLRDVIANVRVYYGTLTTTRVCRDSSRRIMQPIS